MTIVGRWIGLRLDALRSRLPETLLAQPLERSQSPGTGLNSIRRSDKIRSWLSNIGGGVGVFECLFAGIDGPCCDVDLLALGDVERLQERVHVLPAVELPEPTQLCLGDALEGIAGTIAVDKLLDVSGLDLATVVDDLTGRVNESLGQVKSGMIDLGEAKGDVAIESVFRSQVDPRQTYIWLSRAARRMRRNSSESIGREFSRYFFSIGSDCW